MFVFAQIRSLKISSVVPSTPWPALLRPSCYTADPVFARAEGDPLPRTPPELLEAAALEESRNKLRNWRPPWVSQDRGVPYKPPPGWPEEYEHLKLVPPDPRLTLPPWPESFVEGTKKRKRVEEFALREARRRAENLWFEERRKEKQLNKQLDVWLSDSIQSTPLTGRTGASSSSGDSKF